jgi:hypothetical protein
MVVDLMHQCNGNAGAVKYPGKTRGKQGLDWP